METFGDWLRKRREELRISGADLERSSGVSRQYISNLERNVKSELTGRLIQPSVEKVDALAKGLGVAVDEARLAAGYAPESPQRGLDLDGVEIKFGRETDLTDEEKERLVDTVRVVLSGLRAGRDKE